MRPIIFRAKSIENDDNVLDRVDNGWVFVVPLLHCKFGNLMIKPKENSGDVTIYQIDQKLLDSTLVYTMLRINRFMRETLF